MTIRKALHQCGAPWEIKQGKKHYKVYVGNKMVGVMSRSKYADSKPAGIHNMLADIRKAAKAYGQAV